MKPLDVVQSFYEALGRGDATAALAVLDDAVQWTEAEGFSDSDVNALAAAGYDRRAAVAIALAAAGKTLVNTVAHLSKVEIDEGFQGAPKIESAQ